MHRRALLRAAVSTAMGFAVAGRARAQHRPRLVGTVPFVDRDPRPAPPLDRLVGDGLDARRFVDLSTLTPAALVTPAERFFVRTRATATIGADQGWRMHVAGVGLETRTLDLGALRPFVQDMGDHLLECAGNVEPFGLMSAARWQGVPVTQLLDRLSADRPGRRLLITGEDDGSRQWRTSTAGASWVFSREELAQSRAFLATGMNGAPLRPDHGGPVRLIVPGWYGCAAIKWVTRLEWVDDDATATTQMREFARRTHQDGVPALARAYRPPVLDTAAMPVRVEQWQARDGTFYRVIGIIWGGDRPTAALDIGFTPRGALEAVDDCPLPTSSSTWSLWSHEWRPDRPGTYAIALRVRDPSIRTRRLDSGYYIRYVRIAG